MSDDVAMSSDAEQPGGIPPSGRKHEYVPLRWWLIALVLGVVFLASGGLIAWMVDTSPVPDPLPVTASEPARTDVALKRAQLRADIIRNSLGILAGFGGVAAIFLAVRRQYQKERVDFDNNEWQRRNHEWQQRNYEWQQRALANQDREHERQIRVADDNRHDATEKRINELQLKAAEQLGHAKAPVRLAGMYALERLAQGSPSQRSTVVEIVCAYLRMPHPAYPETDERYPEQRQAQLLDEEFAPWRPEVSEEHVVRLAAQRMISRHLRRTDRDANGAEVPNPMYWGLQQVDLSGAVLVRLNAERCTLQDADFSGARLVGGATFRHAEFQGNTTFAYCDFQDKTPFNGAVFDTFPRFADDRRSRADLNGARVAHPAAGDHALLPAEWKYISDEEHGGYRIARIDHSAPDEVRPRLG